MLMVLAFSGTILLVHMRIGDMMGDALFNLTYHTP
jgi:hypothetical protein